jgi:hypothetical protein
MCFAGEDRRRWRQPVPLRRFLVAPVSVRDLLFRAKDLFIAAIVAGIHRTEIDRTATDARVTSGGPRVGLCPIPPVPCPGGTPRALD